MSAANTRKPSIGRQSEGVPGGAPTDDNARRSCPPRLNGSMALPKPDGSEFLRPER